MKFRTILLFGAPGSGKGTQGKILGTIPGFYHLACGDLFRNLRIDSPLGRVFIDYSSKGQLVPDEPTIELWQQHINAQTQLGRFHPDRDTLVLDGILATRPRPTFCATPLMCAPSSASPAPTSTSSPNASSAAPSATTA